MRIEGYLFAFLGVVFAPVTAVYWYFSREPAGTAMLVLSIGLSAMVSFYLLFTAQRMDARPEDRPDAEISEGSGEVGFFSPHSWWPIAMAASFGITTVGLVIGPFMVMIGGVMLLTSTFGLLFEYYVGINRSQGQTVGTLAAMGERPTSIRKFLGE